MSTPTPPPATSGVFLTTIAAMNGGTVMNDLDDALREATKAALDAGAKSKVTLELVISPNGTGAGETPLLKVEDKIKVSVPKKPRQPSVFFGDDEHNLTRRNPNQEEMKLTGLDGGKITKADLKADAVGQGQAKAAGS
jgi:hypothetical protein